VAGITQSSARVHTSVQYLPLIYESEFDWRQCDKIGDSEVMKLCALKVSLTRDVD
jgi:hypothetical protein